MTGATIVLIIVATLAMWAKDRPSYPNIKATIPGQFVVFTGTACVGYCLELFVRYIVGLF